MVESKSKVEGIKRVEESKAQDVKPVEKRAWETPKLEDVSEQVMAQPYIRFT
jgi:hypothetical protein